jgi:hypothetical protein
MRWLLTCLASITLLLAISCDMAKDTADTTEGGGEGAVGIAEKMSQGTLGDTEEDLGE